MEVAENYWYFLKNTSMGLKSGGQRSPFLMLLCRRDFFSALVFQFEDGKGLLSKVVSL